MVFQRKNKVDIFFRLIIACLCLPIILTSQIQDTVSVTVNTSARTASLKNGFISLNINSKGQATYLGYNGVDCIGSSQGGRFYFSYNDASYHELSPETVSIAQQSPDIAEVVYKSTAGALTVEQSYILLKGVSGVYCYVAVRAEKQADRVKEIRFVHRLRPDLFNYGYASDVSQGFMVTPQQLKSATSIMDATYQLSDGSIYTKYDWATYETDDLMHGLLSDHVGVWVISASDEYVNGGPMKQELTVHATDKTPLILKMLQGEHFGASAQTFQSTDEKIYGPYFIYINSAENHDAMIADAKQRARQELTLWPYQWMTHPLYPIERTVVSGRFTVKNDMSPEGLMVVLAQPGIDLYAQGKEYMFWAKTNADGDFVIPCVRSGNYTLYAFATKGSITDEFQRDNISINGNETDLGIINWSPTRYEHLLWQIGQSDRRANEFKFGNVARRYGLWDDVPQNLAYIVGNSSDADDWYYAQTKSGSWKVQFNLDQPFSGDAVLTIAIAGAANEPRVEVYVNDSKQTTLNFSNDASVYRSANTGGKYQLKTITFPANLMKTGENTVVFKLLSVGNRGGLMYDVIKLEAGNQVTSIQMADADQPGHFHLEQNFPNPFNPVTRIAYSISKSGNIKLDVFDVAGRNVSTLFDRKALPGRYEMMFDASHLSSGVYFYQLTIENETITQKMLLLQ